MSMFIYGGTEGHDYLRSEVKKKEKPTPSESYSSAGFASGYHRKGRDKGVTNPESPDSGTGCRTVSAAGSHEGCSSSTGERERTDGISPQPDSTGLGPHPAPLALTPANTLLAVARGKSQCLSIQLGITRASNNRNTHPLRPLSRETRPSAQQLRGAPSLQSASSNCFPSEESVELVLLSSSNPQNILKECFLKTALLSVQTHSPSCLDDPPSLRNIAFSLYNFGTLLNCPLLSNSSFQALKTREMKRFCCFKMESLPKGLLQHRSLELVCWSSLPVPSSSRQSPRPRAAAVAEAATHGAAGWLPRGRCP